MTNQKFQPTRREFAKLALATGSVLAGTLAGSPASTAPETAPTRKASRSHPGKPNILFVFTDQERYRSAWPAGLDLPGHERLMRTGTTFHNHHCPATMCTSSRAVMLTGLSTVDNGMFENADMKYVGALGDRVPTLGHMLRKQGYYTAYKGKWHLDPGFDKNERSLLTEEMEAYGFADYFGPGDIIGHTLGGFHFDHLVAGSAVTWLRRHGRPLNDDMKPWALFVSLVNPHDIMYFNTDAPGENVQDSGALLNRAARAPDHELYRATWGEPVAASLYEPLDAPGRPKAHGEFLKIWDYILGHIPLEEERWRRFNDFYINSTRTVDAQLSLLLRELDATGLSENTIIMFTSDHGEAAGAHGLRGKGPFAYKETMHLPMYVVHPDVQGGRDCVSLTGHIDFVPSILSLAGATPDQMADHAGRELPGRDFSPALSDPTAAKVDTVRDSVLFTYSGLASNDSEIFRINAEARALGRKPIMQMVREGYLPDMKKRGTLRTVYDGRHKFSRYFAPVERHSPKSLDELFARNDVELFDLEQDPGEMNNLARDRVGNAELIQRMSGKLEAIIAAEIGVDDGRELPDIPTVDWTVDRADL
ncbi:sulfatase-like hydrolase/transferase [Ruegeria marina]|uniref:Arylsulfatase A n=1 Tax=Ruegeria marina TaxID=639004 RepID=A0A1G6VTI6_9RHOB|nr:sulfatase-like hydrolase/transferase [Ruegeria marina]SDD56844.1 Arylsulfatase A [Ruegeria marina]